MMNAMPPHDYIVEANRILKEEEERANSLLNLSTIPKMKNIILKVILINNAKLLADSSGSGFYSMFINDKLDQLADV